MKDLSLKLYLNLEKKLQALKPDNGQDLIEYVLIGGIIALGAIFGMNKVATAINNGFVALGTKISLYTS